MQLHQLKSTTKSKSRKRVGRGGKRGTYSGRGQKGQKSRAGSSSRADFRGGNSPVWKLFGKQRGASKKVEVKHRFFRVTKPKPYVISPAVLNENFKNGDIVSPKILKNLGLVDNTKRGVKILNNGDIKKKLNFKGMLFSKTAKEKIIKSGGSIAS